jgi:hypothetical protein
MGFQMTFLIKFLIPLPVLGVGVTDSNLEQILEFT